MTSRLHLVLLALGCAILLALLAWIGSPARAGWVAGHAGAQDRVSTSRESSQADVPLADAEETAMRAPVPAAATEVAPPTEVYSAGVVTGRVLVPGQPASRARGARVRCRPAVGEAVDAFADESGRFEITGLSTGPALVSCSLAGHWSEELRIALLDPDPRVELEIPALPLRTLEIRLDDLDGRPLRLTHDRVPVLMRLQTSLEPRQVRPGEPADPTLDARYLKSVRTAPELIAFMYSEGGLPLELPALSTWRSLEYLAAAGLHLHLTLEGRVLDSVAVPPEGGEIHLRLDTTPIADLFAGLDVRVLEEGTNGPVGRATVVLRQGSGSRTVLRMRADEGGHASFVAMPPGAYRVSAAGVDHVERAIEDVALQPASTTSTRIELERGVRIRGTIRGHDKRNGPVRILAFREEDWDDAPISILGSEAPWADPDSGRFERTALRRGRYRLLACAMNGAYDRETAVRVDATSGSVAGISLDAP